MGVGAGHPRPSLLTSSREELASKCYSHLWVGWLGRGEGEGKPTAGSRVQGPGSRVQSSGFRAQGSGFRVQGSGFRVQSSGFRVQGSGSRAQG